MFEKFPDLVTIRAMGEGFSWETQDRQRDISAAKSAWEMSIKMMNNPAYNLIILDELNIPIRYGNLAINEIISVLKAKRNDLHVVITGRNAQPELIEIADLVTEMTQVKHPFRSGVKAQKGIEF